MRARAMAGEHLVDELRLQLEIARQEVLDEHQLGERRLREVSRAHEH